MDAHELLNVLDIIKNEEVYKERLKVVKEAEESYRKTQYMAKTSEEADILKADAEVIRENALKFREQIDVEMKQKQVAHEEKLVVDRKQLQDEYDVLHLKETDYRKTYNNFRTELAEFNKNKLGFEENVKEFQKNREHIIQLEKQANARIHKLRLVLNSLDAVDVVPIINKG